MGEKRIRRVRRDGQELALISYAIVVPAHGALTKAEEEVARLVARGMSNREIAASRATKERTVANQLKAIFKKFGGRFVIRGGKFNAPEGTPRSRNVVIEFPDLATAQACYDSPEYQANIKVRQPHSKADLIIIEGYDGPQP